MNFEYTSQQVSIQQAIEKICASFDADYWLARDRDGVFSRRVRGSHHRRWLAGYRHA